MQDKPILFAGIDISAGRKPVTFAALDGELTIAALETQSIPDSLSYLKRDDRILVAINRSQTAASKDFNQQFVHTGFKSFSKRTGSHLFLETSAPESFRMLLGQELLPRRSLEGRIQRALVLYEEGFQIPDPMDFFEEITRHKLMRGILPLENIQSAKELDALVCAYVAWLAVNRPNQLDLSPNNFALPELTEN